MSDPVWHDAGAADELRQAPLRQLVIGRTRIALSFREGEFGAISGTCNHGRRPARRGPPRR
jgi:nitrite reductase/ring-hydroxylating ferredoxin subunit